MAKCCYGAKKKRTIRRSWPGFRKKGFNVPLEPWFRNGVFQLRSKGQGLFTEHLNWNGVTDLGRAHAEGAADYAHVLHSIMILEHL